MRICTGDSSALAKRYIADENSPDLDQVLQRTSNLAVSVLCLPEIISALNRRRRERFINQTAYLRARTALETDLTDATIIQIVDDVLVHCVRLLETTPLQASDAIHVSSAIVWGADVFISADARQCAAAKRFKLEVVQL